MQNITELFYTYRDDVYRLALSFTRSHLEAEDICQTVFLKLMEQNHITPGKEKSWLTQVTVNECRSLLRSAWWNRTAPLDENLPPESLHVNEVLHSVLKLPPKYRVVIYLYYYEGYSTEEIGKLLKISRSAVTTRLNRARQLLRNQLKEV